MGDFLFYWVSGTQNFVPAISISKYFTMVCGVVGPEPVLFVVVVTAVPDDPFPNPLVVPIPTCPDDVVGVAPVATRLAAATSPPNTLAAEPCVSIARLVPAPVMDSMSSPIAVVTVEPDPKVGA